MRFAKIVAISASLLALASNSFAGGNGLGRISLIKGDVLVKTEDSPEWVPASINTPIGEGDSIWSPDDARVEVQLTDGSFLRLDEKSSVDVVTVEDDFFQFHLGMGHLYVSTGQMKDRSLQVDFRDTSVKVYDRSRFRIDLVRDEEEISIFKGSAYVESDGSKAKVRAGEMLTLEDGSSEMSALRAPDEWEKWNSERDRTYTVRRTERTYLPDELETYSSDFERNGEWVQEREYGYIWRPTVISAGWAPYTVGRWMWRRGDYVWVSYEPWGWAPFHYGRWVSHPRYGWCWVPPARGDVFWSPGYVGWISTPTYVGWVPLAPGETYYGYGNYGRFSININLSHEHRHQPKIVYKNVYVNNGVTVVQKDSFASGKIVRVRPKENIFEKGDRVVVPRPEVKPRSREAYMPVVKTIAPGKLPPAAVAQPKVKELKKRHPKVREMGTDDLKTRGGNKPEMRDGDKEQRKSEKQQLKEERREEKVRDKELRKEEKERDKDQRREEKARQKEEKEQRQFERRQLKEQGEDGGAARRDSDTRTLSTEPNEGRQPEEKGQRSEKKQKKVWKVKQKEQKEQKEGREGKEGRREH